MAQERSNGGTQRKKQSKLVLCGLCNCRRSGAGAHIKSYQVAVKKLVFTSMFVAAVVVVVALSSFVYIVYTSGVYSFATTIPRIQSRSDVCVCVSVCRAETQR